MRSSDWIKSFWIHNRNILMVLHCRYFYGDENCKGELYQLNGDNRDKGGGVSGCVTLNPYQLSRIS